MRNELGRDTVPHSLTPPPHLCSPGLELYKWDQSGNWATCQGWEVSWAPWFTLNACQVMGALEPVELTWDRKQLPKYNFAQLKLIPNVKYQRMLIMQTVIKNKMLSRKFTVIPIKMQSHFQLHKILILLSSFVSNKGYYRIKNAGWKCKIKDNLPLLLGNTERRLLKKCYNRCAQ